MTFQFKTVAIAGTFDHLHKGHKSFVFQAFKRGGRVLIGLTSDKYVKKKFSIFNFQFSKKIQIQNFQTRKRELEKFLKKEKLFDRAKIIPIDDVYGPATGKTDIEALLVTTDTFSGGQRINLRRRQLGMTPLKLLKIPLILAQDRQKISSTRVRLGEINRLGKVYGQLLQFAGPISPQLREALKISHGILIKGQKGSDEVNQKLLNHIATSRRVLLSSVGDEVTKLLNQLGQEPDIAIFDFRVERRPKYKELSELGFSKEDAYFSSYNKPGHISLSLVTKIRYAIKEFISAGKKGLIRVMGEEDLAALPMILLAPLGAHVIYGQPGEGVVIVEVTEDKKQEIAKLIRRF